MNKLNRSGNMWYDKKQKLKNTKYNLKYKQSIK
jgi:hypothetical protein